MKKNISEIYQSIVDISLLNISQQYSITITRYITKRWYDHSFV